MNPDATQPGSNCLTPNCQLLAENHAPPDVLCVDAPPEAADADPVQTAEDGPPQTANEAAEELIYCGRAVQDAGAQVQVSAAFLCHFRASTRIHIGLLPS